MTEQAPPDEDSRCLLLVLSHDELGVIVDGLADPLQPVVAVALSSTCLGLRTPLRAALDVLQQRHEKAAALGRKGGKLAYYRTQERPEDRMKHVPLTCADLREASRLSWGGRLSVCRASADMTVNDMATLGMLLPFMPTLTQLALNHNDMGDAGVKTLCECLGHGNTPSLSYLDLGNNQFGPLGAEALAAALRRGAMPKLEQLALSSNLLGNQGVAALALALRKLPVLKRLDLSACKFGDQDVASLLDNLAKDDFKALEILVIVANNVTDVGCAKLVAAINGGRMPKLRYVGSARNSASDAAAQSIMDAIRKRGWVVD